MKQRKMFKRYKGFQSYSDFEYYRFEVTLWSEDRKTPIKFERVKTDPNTKLTMVQCSWITMIKKQYWDELLEDELLLQRNKDNLGLIKSFDDCLRDPTVSVRLPRDEVYRSAQSARMYEVFPGYLLESSTSKRPCLIGIDSNSIYILDQSEERDPAEKGLVLIPKKLTPSFSISEITYFNSNGRFVRINVKHQGEIHEDLIILETVEASAIIAKLNALHGAK